MARTHPCYLVHKDRSGEWRWTFTAVNGKVIAVSSESYKRRVDCQRGVEIMKASAGVPVFTGGKVEATRAKHEADWYWRDLDPDDSGSTIHEAIHMMGVGVVCNVSSSYIGPSFFAAIVPVLDPESDDTEEVTADTFQECTNLVNERYAMINARRYAPAAEMGQEAAPGDPDE